MFLIHTLLMTAFALTSGLIVAAAIAWLSWTAFKLFRHPQWGPAAALILIVGAFYPWLRSSELLQMLVLFSALAACVAWVSPSSLASKPRP